MTQALVYQATNIVNGKRYIGFTSRTLAAREWEHRAYARKGGGYMLQRAMRKYGGDNFTFSVLGDFDGDVELAKLYEIEAIAKYKPEYNILSGGEGHTPTEELRERLRKAQTGKKASPETLAKMRASQTGRRQSPETKEKLAALWRGKPRSPETIEKMRASMKGRASKPAGWKHTPETLAKMKGFRHSPETLRKMSEAKRGKPSPLKGKKVSAAHLEAIRVARQKWTFVATEAHRVQASINVRKAVEAIRKPVVCLNDGRVFSSAREASLFYGFTKNKVSKIATGAIKNHPSGLRFEYVKNGDAE